MSASVPEHQLAACMMLYYLSSQVGTLLRTAVGSAILQGVFGGCLRHRIGGMVGEEMVIHNMLDEMMYVLGLSGLMQRVVRGCSLVMFQILSCEYRIIPLVLFVIRCGLLIGDSSV